MPLAERVGQRGGEPGGLLGQLLLSRRTGHPLSASRQLAALGSGRGGRRAGDHHRRGDPRHGAKCPYLLVGWLWYLGMLVPVIGLVQVGAQAMADRYTYLPMIGLTIALAWLLASAAETWRWGGLVLGAAAALAVAVLMGCAWQQTSYWRNSETLWDHHQDRLPERDGGRRFVLIGAARGDGLLGPRPAQNRLDFVEQRLLPRLDFLLRRRPDRRTRPGRSRETPLAGPTAAATPS